MGKYIIRALKYLVKLAILLALVFFLMRRSDTASGSIIEIFSTLKGQLFAAAVLIWCIFYPKLEFVRRHSNYDMGTRKAAIIRALNAGGMTLFTEEENRMVFHGSALRRLWWLYEDAVTITPSLEGGINIEGPRRFVMEAQQRIPNYVQNEE